MIALPFHGINFSTQKVITIIEKRKIYYHFSYQHTQAHSILHEYTICKFDGTIGFNYFFDISGIKFYLHIERWNTAKYKMYKPLWTLINFKRYWLIKETNHCVDFYILKNCYPLLLCLKIEKKYVYCKSRVSLLFI